MSNGTPPIQPAPVPPSIAGIPQPVFESGSATSPAAGPITGSPIIPPPTIGDPEGFPVFPPVPPNTAPVPVPVGPLVGPAVAPAPVPPSVPGVQQPQFVPPGSATVPASLFPSFTTTPPSPPIVFANVFKIGAIPPPLPSTPGQNPPPIIPSPVPTIPQLPWNPNPTPEPPPVNTVRPVVQIVTDLNVGSQLALTTGTWTGTGGTITYAREWLRNGSPIAGATAPGYVLTTADVGAQISGIVTAKDANGEASAESLPVGPITETPLESPTNNMAPIATLNPTYILCTGGNWIPANPMYTLSYQWFADGTAVEGATGSTWTFAGHEGETAYCAVTATNAAGSSVATNTNTVTIPSAVGDEDAEPSTLPAPPPVVRHGSIPKAKSKKKR